MFVFVCVAVEFHPITYIQNWLILPLGEQCEVHLNNNFKCSCQLYGCNYGIIIYECVSHNCVISFVIFLWNIEDDEAVLQQLWQLGTEPFLLS